MAKEKKDKKEKKTKLGKAKLNYYEAFSEQAELAHKEAELLVEVVKNFSDAKSVAEYLPRAHKIEHDADDLNHAVMQAIDVDFVTPIDREDIIELTAALDDIVDSIEEVIQRIYVFDVHFMHKDVLPLVKLLEKATGTLVESMEDFQDQKKYDHFIESIHKVGAVEEEVDAAYLQIMRRLYTKDNDNPLRIIVWTDIFDRIEDCADRIDETAVIMGNIILRNS